MQDLKLSFNKHCNCVQKDCPIWGNCVLCVENHKVNRNHIPECMQELVRESIATLCRLVEFTPVEKRPTQAVFDRMDKTKFIEDSLRRHS